MGTKGPSYFFAFALHERVRRRRPQDVCRCQVRIESGSGLESRPCHVNRAVSAQPMEAEVGQEMETRGDGWAVACPQTGATAPWNRLGIWASWAGRISAVSL